MKKLITSEDAKPTKIQHTTPCRDCPWRRKSIAGWLGGTSPEEFVRIAHSESTYDCHAKIGPQCAGMAIYRANVGKLPRDPKGFRLPADKIKVFSWPMEFLEHHK